MHKIIALATLFTIAFATTGYAQVASPSTSPELSQSQVPVLQKTASTERLDLIKTSLGIIGTILGVVVGYILASYSKWRERKRRTRNMRRLILTELFENYGNLIAWMPKDKDDKLQTQSTGQKLQQLDHTWFPVIQAHFDRLAELEVKMMCMIYEVYYQAKKLADPSTNYANFSPQDINKMADAFLNTMGTALKTFKNGEEMLKELEKRRSEAIESMLKSHSEKQIH